MASALRAERERMAAAMDKLFALLDQTHEQIRAYQDVLRTASRRYDELTNAIYDEEHPHERNGSSGGDEPGCIQVP